MAEEEPTTQSETESVSPQTDKAGRGLRYQKTKAVCKRCRRLGQKLFLKGEKCFTQKCPFTRRKYAPGEHGQKPQRLSDYGQQLQAKQKALAIYDLRDKQLRKIYSDASKTPISTKEAFARQLELRLDSILYTSGLALSRNHGRQLVSHNHVKVNNEKVTSPSYQVKEGDKIEVAPEIVSGKQGDAIKRARDEKNIPQWIKTESENEVEVGSQIENMAEGLGFDIQAIIEFYSR